MDMKVYYQKLRQIEAGIADPEVVVVSTETADGGRAGVRTEVRRAVAARMVVEGRARLATREEAEEHRQAAAEARRVAEQAALAGRVQLTVLTEAEMRALKKGPSTKS